ncbi:hypothetical protein CEXT_220431 [Caerostris extrusa]|uniref:Uncharacterized protein n=1 Tax=Caerostris extrusa TaxID=172846 RepID=A0AAV4T1N0_CAEEX|nr:hypothetical protein CEXT_220431 [Caerostris extrusa]
MQGSRSLLNTLGNVRNSGNSHLPLAGHAFPLGGRDEPEDPRLEEIVYRQERDAEPQAHVTADEAQYADGLWERK